MAAEQTFRRMTLRQLLMNSEKSTRDLIEHIHSNLLTAVADNRELSRPKRRSSHFPSFLVIQNALKRLEEVGNEIRQQTEHLNEQLVEIRDRARKDRESREKKR